jgi:hypothetical protein
MYTKSGIGMAGGLGGGGEGCGRPGRQYPRRGKINIYGQKMSFLLSKILQLSSQVKGSSINDCDLLKGQFLFGIAIVCTFSRRPKAYQRHCVQTFGWKN